MGVAKVTKRNKFALAVLKAAKIREKSYDHKASDKAMKDLTGSVDFSKFYQKNLLEAAEEALREVGLNVEMAQPIYLLLKLAWNDALEWAENQD